MAHYATRNVSRNNLFQVAVVVVVSIVLVLVELIPFDAASAAAPTRIVDGPLRDLLALQEQIQAHVGGWRRYLLPIDQLKASCVRFGIVLAIDND